MTLAEEVTVVAELLRAAATRQSSSPAPQAAQPISSTTYLGALYTLYTIMVRTQGEDEHRFAGGYTRTTAECSEAPLQTHTPTTPFREAVSSSSPSSSSSATTKGEIVTLLVNVAVDHALKGILSHVELQMWMCVLHEALQRHRCRQAMRAHQASRTQTTQETRLSTRGAVSNSLHRRRWSNMSADDVHRCTYAEKYNEDEDHADTDARPTDARECVRELGSSMGEGSAASAHVTVHSACHALHQGINRTTPLHTSSCPPNVSGPVCTTERRNGSADVHADGVPNMPRCDEAVVLTLDELLERPVQTLWQGIARLTARLTTSRATDWVTRSHHHHPHASESALHSSLRHYYRDDESCRVAAVSQHADAQTQHMQSLPTHSSDKSVPNSTEAAAVAAADANNYYCAQPAMTRRAASLCPDTRCLSHSLRLLRVLLMHTRTLSLHAERRQLPHLVHTSSCAVRLSALSALPHLIPVSRQSLMDNSVSTPSTSSTHRRCRLTDDWMRYVQNGLALPLSQPQPQPQPQPEETTNRHRTRGRGDDTSPSATASAAAAAVVLASVRALRELMELSRVELDATRAKALLRPLMKLCQTATAMVSTSHIQLTRIGARPDIPCSPVKDTEEDADVCAHTIVPEDDAMRADDGHLINSIRNETNTCAHGRCTTPCLTRFTHALKECGMSSAAAADSTHASLCSSPSLCASRWSVCALMDSSLRLSEEASDVCDVYARIADEAALVVGYVLTCYQVDFVSRPVDHAGASGSTMHVERVKAAAPVTVWRMLGSHSGDVAQAAEVRRIVLMMRSNSNTRTSAAATAYVHSLYSSDAMSSALQHRIALALSMCLVHTTTRFSAAAAVRALFVLLIPATREVRVTHVPCIIIAAMARWARESVLDSMRVALIRALLPYCIWDCAESSSSSVVAAAEKEAGKAHAHAESRADTPSPTGLHEGSRHTCTDAHTCESHARVQANHAGLHRVQGTHARTSSTAPSMHTNAHECKDPSRAAPRTGRALDAGVTNAVPDGTPLSGGAVVGASVGRVVCHTALCALHEVCATLSPISTALAQEVAAVLRRVWCGRGGLVSDILALLAQRCVTFQSSLLRMCSDTLLHRPHEPPSFHPNATIRHGSRTSGKVNEEGDLPVRGVSRNINKVERTPMATPSAALHRSVRRTTISLTAAPSADSILYIRAILAVRTNTAALTGCRLSALIYLSLQQPLARAQPSAGDFTMVECLLRLSTALLTNSLPNVDNHGSTNINNASALPTNDAEGDVPRRHETHTNAASWAFSSSTYADKEESKSHVQKSQTLHDTRSCHAHSGATTHTPHTSTMRGLLSEALRRRIRFSADMHIRLLVSHAQRSFSSVRAAVAACLFMRQVSPTHAGDGALTVALLEGQLVMPATRPTVSHSALSPSLSSSSSMLRSSHRHNVSSDTATATTPTNTSNNTNSVSQEGSSAAMLYDAWLSQLKTTVYEAVAVRSAWPMDGGSMRWLLMHAVNDIVHALTSGIALRLIWTHTNDGVDMSYTNSANHDGERNTGTDTSRSAHGLLGHEHGNRIHEGNRRMSHTLPCTSVHDPCNEVSSTRKDTHAAYMSCSYLSPFTRHAGTWSTTSASIAMGAHAHTADVATHALRLLGVALHQRGRSAVSADVSFVARVLQRIQEGFDAAGESAVRRTTMMVVMYALLGREGCEGLRWRDALCTEEYHTNSDHSDRNTNTSSDTHNNKNHNHNNNNDSNSDSHHKLSEEDAVSWLRLCGSRWRRYLHTWRQSSHSPLSHRILSAVLTSRLLMHSNAAVAEEAVNRYTVQAAQHSGEPNRRHLVSSEAMTVAQLQRDYARRHGLSRTHALAHAWVKQTLLLRQGCTVRTTTTTTTTGVSRTENTGTTSHHTAEHCTNKSPWPMAWAASWLGASEQRTGAPHADSTRPAVVMRTNTHDEADEDDAEHVQEDENGVCFILAVCAMSEIQSANTHAAAEPTRWLCGGFIRRTCATGWYSVRLMMHTLWSYSSSSLINIDGRISTAHKSEESVLLAAMSITALTGCLTAVGMEGMGWIGSSDACAAALLQMLRMWQSGVIQLEHTRNTRMTTTHPSAEEEAEEAQNSMNNSNHETRREGSPEAERSMHSHRCDDAHAHAPLAWFLRETLPPRLMQFAQHRTHALRQRARFLRLLQTAPLSSSAMHRDDARGTEGREVGGAEWTRTGYRASDTIRASSESESENDERIGAARHTNPVCSRVSRCDVLQLAPPLTSASVSAVWNEWVWWAMRCTGERATHTEASDTKSGAKVCQGKGAVCCSMWPFCVSDWAVIHESLSDATARHSWQSWAVWYMTHYHVHHMCRSTSMDDDTISMDDNTSHANNHNCKDTHICPKDNTDSANPSEEHDHVHAQAARADAQTRTQASRPLSCCAEAMRCTKSWVRELARLVRDHEGAGLQVKMNSLALLHWILRQSYAAIDDYHRDCAARVSHDCNNTPHRPPMRFTGNSSPHASRAAVYPPRTERPLADCADWIEDVAIALLPVCEAETDLLPHAGALALTLLSAHTTPLAAHWCMKANSAGQAAHLNTDAHTCAHVSPTRMYDTHRPNDSGTNEPSRRLRRSRLAVAVRSLLPSSPALSTSLASALLRGLLHMTQHSLSSSSSTATSISSAYASAEDGAARRATQSLVALLWLRCCCDPCAQPPTCTQTRNDAPLERVLRGSTCMQPKSIQQAGVVVSWGAGVTVLRTLASVVKHTCPCRASHDCTRSAVCEQRVQNVMHASIPEDKNDSNADNRFHDDRAGDVPTTRVNSSHALENDSCDASDVFPLDEGDALRSTSHGSTDGDIDNDNDASGYYYGGVCADSAQSACQQSSRRSWICWPLTHRVAGRDGLGSGAAQKVLACQCAHWTATLALRQHRCLVPPSTDGCVVDWEEFALPWPRKRCAHCEAEDEEGQPPPPPPLFNSSDVCDSSNFITDEKERSVPGSMHDSSSRNSRRDLVHDTVCMSKEACVQEEELGRVWRVLACLCTCVPQLDLSLRHAAGELACMTLLPYTTGDTHAKHANSVAPTLTDNNKTTNANHQDCLVYRVQTLWRCIGVVVPHVSVHHRRCVSACLLDLLDHMLHTTHCSTRHDTQQTMQTMQTMQTATTTEAAAMASVQLLLKLALHDPVERVVIESALHRLCMRTPHTASGQPTMALRWAVLHACAVLYTCKDTPLQADDWTEQDTTTEDWASARLVASAAALLRDTGLRAVSRALNVSSTQHNRECGGGVCRQTMAAALRQLPPTHLCTLALSHPAALLFVECVVANCTRPVTPMPTSRSACTTTSVSTCPSEKPAVRARRQVPVVRATNEKNRDAVDTNGVSGEDECEANQHTGRAADIPPCEIRSNHDAVGYSILSQPVVPELALRHVRHALQSDVLCLEEVVECLCGGVPALCTSNPTHTRVRDTIYKEEEEGVAVCGGGGDRTKKDVHVCTNGEDAVQAARIAVVVSLLVTGTLRRRAGVTAVVARLLQCVLRMRAFVVQCPHASADVWSEEQRVMWMRWCVRGVLLRVLPVVTHSDEEAVRVAWVGELGESAMRDVMCVGQRWMRELVPRYSREMRTVVSELRQEEAQRLRCFLELSNKA